MNNNEGPRQDKQLVPPMRQWHFRAQVGCDSVSPLGARVTVIHGELNRLTSPCVGDR